MYYVGLDWVGSMPAWVRLGWTGNLMDWVAKNGPMDIFGLFGLTHSPWYNIIDILLYNRHPCNTVNLENIEKQLCTSSTYYLLQEFYWKNLLHIQ